MKNNKGTKTVFKSFFNLEKEVKWINEMNKNGWKLVYIKCGCLYTFVKTEPDEYITILHAEEKEKISELTAFAAQCGYESIPHTNDGAGTILYFTGKKEEIFSEFVQETSEKIKSLKIIRKFFKMASVMYGILTVVTLLLSALFVAFNITIGFDVFIAIMTAIIVFMFIFSFSGLLFLCSVKRRYTKRINELNNDSTLYE